MEENKGKKKKIIIAAAAAAGIIALIIAGILLVPRKNTSVVTAYPVSGLGDDYGYGSSDTTKMQGVIVDEFSQNVTQRSDLKLKRIHVRRGQRVKKGAVLVTYDCRRDELDMKLKEIEVLKRERDVQNRENALATLRRTGRDTYEDSGLLDSTDEEDDGTDTDTDSDARLPAGNAFAELWSEAVAWLEHPFGTVVKATGEEPGEQGGGEQGGGEQGGDGSGGEATPAPSGDAKTDENGGDGSNTDPTKTEGSGDENPGTEQDPPAEEKKSVIPEGVTPEKDEVTALDDANRNCMTENPDDNTVLEVYLLQGGYDLIGQAVKDALDLIAKGTYSNVVFKRYSQQDIDDGNDNPFEVRFIKGSYMSDSIHKDGAYTLEYIFDHKKDLDENNLEISPTSNKVTKGSSYTYTLKNNGATFTTDVEWTVTDANGKPLKKTTIDKKTGVLSVDSSEKASKLIITASVNGLSVSKTVRVNSPKKSRSSDSGNSSSSGTTKKSSSTTSTSDNGTSSTSSNESDDIDSDNVVYKGEELRLQIEQREEELEQEKLDLEEARIKYNELKQKVEAATIRASMAGQVTVAHTKNNLPESGKPIVVLKSRGGTYVQFDVNEMKMDIVQPGGRMTCKKTDGEYDFETDEGFDDGESGSGMSYEAIVTDIADYPSGNKQSTDSWYSDDSSASNPDSSFYTVTGTISNANGLNAGDPMEISFSAKQMKKKEDDKTVAIMAPFIRQEGRRYYVYKVGKDDRLVKQYVTIGKTSYGVTTILKGLNADDYVAFPYSKDELSQARTRKEEDTTTITDTLYQSPEFGW